ncbi:hypothetical protein ACSHWO_02440 [Streptomyces sp. HUAS TT3]|uniref:hypothetical protein n=1 Tax=Streptomyces sp. HUAS TT3 TaxID=3447510 RepID=UPI003F65A3F1
MRPVYRPSVQEPVDLSTAAATVFGAARAGHEQAAVRSGGDEIQIWDFKQGKVVESFAAETGTPRPMGFDQTGRLLAVVTTEGSSGSVTWRRTPGGPSPTRASNGSTASPTRPG